MRIFDTHTHLLTEAFAPDRPALLETIRTQGVELVMEACCTEADIPGILAFTQTHDWVYGSAGLHPEELHHVGADALAQVEKALSRPKILAVGEIGLDYHWEDNPPREMQKAYLDSQLSMAGEYNLPVILHVRDAHGDCMDILRAHKQHLQGVMHCFSGSYETARECLDLGLYIGIGGVLTFKNGRKLKEVAQKVPLDRLVLETDCPYMAPEPLRGTRNHPGNLVYVRAALAALRGLEEEPLSEILFENGKRLFHIGEANGGAE